MELKGIDAKLFTMKPECPFDDNEYDSNINDALKRAEKYVNDPGSYFVAVYDYVFWRKYSTVKGKISIAKFPPTIAREDEEHVYMLFLQLLKCYKKEKSLDKLPWSYPEIKNKLRACVQTVEENRFVKCLVRLLKSLAIAAISAGVYHGIYKLMPHLEKASGLEFFAGLVWLVAGISCLAFSLWSVILLLGGLGPSKSQRQDLAKAYVDAMRYIRYRILWFQETCEIDLVPSYLAEAEKELLSLVENVKDVLRRELGKDWLVPMETVCYENIEGLMEYLETIQVMQELRERSEYGPYLGKKT